MTCQKLEGPKFHLLDITANQFVRRSLLVVRQFVFGLGSMALSWVQHTIGLWDFRGVSWLGVEQFDQRSRHHLLLLPKKKKKIVRNGLKKRLVVRQHWQQYNGHQYLSPVLMLFCLYFCHWTSILIRLSSFFFFFCLTRIF